MQVLIITTYYTLTYRNIHVCKTY